MKCCIAQKEKNLHQDFREPGRGNLERKTNLLDVDAEKPSNYGSPSIGISSNYGLFPNVRVEKNNSNEETESELSGVETEKELSATEKAASILEVVSLEPRR